MQFNIEQYSGKFVMHCKTIEDAGEFLTFLHEHNRRWGSGKSYLHTNYLDLHDCDTCYAFNLGQFGNRQWYINDGFTILEFDDFEWGNDIKPTENDIKIMDKFFSGFAIN